jgi:ADP-ribose pyrophosphatase YjhB (NUDIX family)
MTTNAPHAAHFELKVPDGDDRPRAVCASCGFINYVNPKIVVGSVVAVDGGVLLCRRAIEPRKGFWTLPAGFLEEGETVEQGAAREAFEEARARLKLGGLLAIYSIPRISQVQIMFRAELAEPGFAPGPESLETAVFALDALPSGELAFPSVAWALADYQRFLKGESGPFGNPA